MSEELWAIVGEKLRLGWSREQISGRLRLVWTRHFKW